MLKYKILNIHVKGGFMRISVKGRYGLSSMIYMAQNYASGEYITVVSLSDKLKISKIYLEQVFSLLKRAKLVLSTKGSQGGYQLAKKPNEITALEILSAIEMALFERTSETVSEGSIYIERTMQEIVFDKLDKSITTELSNITLEALAFEADKRASGEEYMYYL